MKKKGVELGLNTVVIAALVILVLVIVSIVFIRLFSKETGQIGEQVASLDDNDKDGIVNMFDKCPCKPGEREYEGCTSEGQLNSAKENPAEYSASKCPIKK